MESFEDFCPKMFSWLPLVDLDIFYRKVRSAIRTFIGEEFVELVEDLGEILNKYS